MNIVKYIYMKLSYSKIYFILILASQLSAQFYSPARFSLRSTVQDTFMSQGLLSNIVAEIKIMGDSLTWLGTGQGKLLRYMVIKQVYFHSSPQTQTAKAQPTEGLCMMIADFILST